MRRNDGTYGIDGTEPRPMPQTTERNRPVGIRDYGKVLWSLARWIPTSQQSTLQCPRPA
jgi:hypothetical protein